MRVGLTYDLRQDYLAKGFGEEETAEFDAPETIAAIEGVLKRRGFKVERIGNVRSLVSRLAAGKRWDFVFNIAEGMHGVGREAQVPALLDAYAIPYTFSDPLTMALTLDKAMAKRIVRDNGLPTAPFLLVETERHIVEQPLAFPVFAKPVAEGTGKGITEASRIQSWNELVGTAVELLGRYRQPVLVESYLPGREFTVGIVGTGATAEVIAVMEIKLLTMAERGAYSYLNKELCADRVAYQLADDDEARLAGETALAAWRALNCRDGGRVDLRSDPYCVPQFLEVNPLAGLRPGHSDLVILSELAGWTYDQLVNRIIDSCLERALPTETRPRRLPQVAIA
jgi:D-alanine-D-alanine ligase